VARAARAEELPLALALLDRDFGATSLGERAREVCALAFAERRDGEHRALVAARGVRLAGVVLFGAYAGTVGGARLHALAGDDEARDALLAAALASCRASGERYLLAELADEPALRPMLDALRRASFIEEARVADLVRDGVDIVMLARPV
jgi:hypothetical protein